MHLVVAALLAVAAMQTAPPKSVSEAPSDAKRAAAASPLPDAESSDDIIVSALRIPRDKLPTGVYWDYQTAFGSRLDREKSDLYVRCAMNWASGAEMRKVLDGEPGSAPMYAAQGIIILKGRGCQPGLQGLGHPAIPGPDGVLVYGRSAIDRSIIVERALHGYAGTLDLSRDETQSDAVQRRFYQREGQRNRLRRGNDWAAFVVSTCMVREEPVLATRLVKAVPGSDLEKGLLQAMFVDGRSCLGGTRRITVDPAHFRAYIVDAYYRWLVAARDVASLVPDGDAIAAR